MQCYNQNLYKKAAKLKDKREESIAKIKNDRKKYKPKLKKTSINKQNFLTEISEIKANVENLKKELDNYFVASFKEINKIITNSEKLKATAAKISKTPNY